MCSYYTVYTVQTLKTQWMYDLHQHQLESSVSWYLTVHPAHNIGGQLQVSGSGAHIALTLTHHSTYLTSSLRDKRGIL